MLTRTKTSGAGKAREQLALHVASGAFIAQPRWLEQGWKLWAAVDIDRDYFLGVPLPDLSNMRAVEARYSDGVAISRALLSKAESSRGGALLILGEALSFWTEHSARACMPSWAGCITTFGKDWLDLLGRWRSGQSSDYVRTSRKRVAAMQVAVAEAVRGGSAVGTEFDEDELMAELHQHLATAGVEADKITEQLSLLYFGVSDTETEKASASGDEEIFGPQSPVRTAEKSSPPGGETPVQDEPRAPEDAPAAEENFAEDSRYNVTSDNEDASVTKGLPRDHTM